MKLRQWQADCLEQAWRHYTDGQHHFLCLATPGAGKTHLAATLAARLLREQCVDLVIGFAPSLIVAQDFAATLAEQTRDRFDGGLGARGTTLTYQAMLNQTDAFWSLFRRFRVFAIFDEIHHCAGQTLSDTNAWGERLITQIQDQAAFTLALTGTPWRSDQRPITLARYGTDTVACDYRYGLDRAIADGVCRVPQLTLIDNEQVEVHRGAQVDTYGSLRALVEDEACGYEALLRSEALIHYCIAQANRQLDELRRTIPDAGGLIVATSVAHAKQIAALLEKAFGETAAIATYQEPDALATIRRFTQNREKWIVSVGMISEGTNVPRLRVCCHLTRVKTELYFRQVLGRILRAQGRRCEYGYLYMPAEPTLVTYAERLAEDIPAASPIIRDRWPVGIQVLDDTKRSNEVCPASENEHQTMIRLGGELSPLPNSQDSEPPRISGLADAYETCVNWSDRFRLEVLSNHGLPCR